MRKKEVMLTCGFHYHYHTLTIEITDREAVEVNNKFDLLIK